jgi:hypothetical protein
MLAILFLSLALFSISAVCIRKSHVQIKKPIKYFLMAGGYVFQCLALFAIFYVFRHYPQANTLSFFGIYFLCLAIIAVFIVKLIPANK